MDGVEVYPQLVVFDLDATLWETEMYLIDGPPFTHHKETNTVSDCRGNEVRLCAGSVRVIEEIVTSDAFKQGELLIGYASRTNYPQWADECLRLLRCPGHEHLSMSDIAKVQEIYPGDKKTHFRRLTAASDTPLETAMFFDNERRNCTSVAQLGVTCVYTPDGMTYKAWRRGLQDYAEKQARQEYAEKQARKE